MSCEICGRNSCTKSFHSLEEQEIFDSVADNVKERMAKILKNKINRLDYKIIDNNVWINIDEVMNIINSY